MNFEEPTHAVWNSFQGRDLDMKELSQLRTEYRRFGLDRVNGNPFVQFGLWLQDALDSNLIEPHAMALGTVDPTGRPSVRMLLLRGFDERGFVFYTHCRSRKGRDLENNPQAALTFWWGALERQIRIEGRVEKVSSEESDAYFLSRPKESQWATMASPQSEKIPSRQWLEERANALKEHVPVRPPDWGGYRLIPDGFEFWQGRPARLHDRFVYERRGESWDIDRLAP